MATAVELVDAMIAYYDDDPRLWLQRDFHQARLFDGKVVESFCLSGLRSHVIIHTGTGFGTPAHHALVSKMALEVVSRGHRSVESFNDSSERTFEDIKDFLQAVRRRLL